MAASLVNEAAWFDKVHDKPLKVRPGPVHNEPGVGEVIIKVEYIAINPSEVKAQTHPIYHDIALTYPWVAGCDVAGTIAVLGPPSSSSPASQRFSVGDRVVALTISTMSNDPRDGGHQRYARARQRVVIKVPAHIPLERAAFLPLSLTTNVDAMHWILKLDAPVREGEELEAAKKRNGGKVVLIWGGASSLGVTAVQMAKAAGYTVLVTASAKNKAWLLNEVGADMVVDYRDADCMAQIDEVMKKDGGKKFAGVYDTISTSQTTESCVQLLKKYWGGATEEMKIARTLVGDPKTNEVKIELAIGGRCAYDADHQDPALFGDSVYNPDHPWPRILEDWVPQALETGQLKCVLPVRIIEGGVNSVQHAMDIVREGVSAQKIVVKMDKPRN